jgi:hypothetical protein
MAIFGSGNGDVVDEAAAAGGEDEVMAGGPWRSVAGNYVHLRALGGSVGRRPTDGKSVRRPVAGYRGKTRRIGTASKPL